MRTMTDVTAGSIRDAFNEALNFALDEIPDDHDKVAFLTLWREGCWDEIERDFPEWRRKEIPV